CDAVGGGNSGWVTGNTGASNAHWAETDFLLYRMLFTGLPGDGTTVHTVTIGYDVLKSGVHAIDYLGTYDWTESIAMGNNPCSGVTGTHCNPFNGAGTSRITIPVDPEIQNFPAPRATMPTDGEFTMWGGTLLTIAYEPYAGGEERRVTLTFKATVSNPVLAWSGHVAWRGEWGSGNSAGGITGSPYHMRLIDLDGQGGNQDRSLSADAVLVPADITIVKQTLFGGNPISVNADFSFSSTGLDFENDGNNLFVLNTSTNASTSTLVLTSGIGTGFSYPVTEIGLPSAWTLSDIVCVSTMDGGFPNTNVTTVDLVTLTATIRPDEAESIVCTFKNAFTGTTAAPASISGRVATADGTGIYGARMVLTNASTGETVYATTNPFGYYTFEGMPVSDFYILGVGHKRYTFAENQRTFTLNEDLVGVDFIAN
ncbi:MAG: carboxypeptidase-like regulatory domain-containing protein, partial [Pyrinomonadaceae bacterium]|nr:carboxypeptidase-like regulatory domain-containing protein [Pyrinomonadaceae bacterium]